MTLPPWVRERLLQPALDQLKQGLTPEKLALSAVLGVAFGCFPVLGVTTAMCVAAAVALRLSHPVIQAANYGAGPLQVAFFIPLVKLGDAIVSRPSLPLTLEGLQEHMAQGPWHFVQLFGESVAHGIVAWLVVTPPLVGLGYAAGKPLAARLARRFQGARAARQSG